MSWRASAPFKACQTLIIPIQWKFQLLIGLIETLDSPHSPTHETGMECYGWIFIPCDDHAPGFLDFDVTPPTSRAAYYERYCPVSSPPSQPTDDPVRIHSKRFISPAYFHDFLKQPFRNNANAFIASLALSSQQIMEEQNIEQGQLKLHFKV
ncbi:hypothetical protein CDAR_186121 [Caerostris darwini]|uniref:Uncharacterized protein n=1 Tax=Caerostris darwini TaxID=1538125 RepID=A0AAV4WE05_9ARAC|nr:hypothetical protein CDAR_186121 [Caerostris darwini]